MPLSWLWFAFLINHPHDQMDLAQIKCLLATWSTYILSHLQLWQLTKETVCTSKDMHGLCLCCMCDLGMIRQDPGDNEEPY